MSMPQIEMSAETGSLGEPVELKKQVPYHEVDESLSEWERARVMSKTWSMEQD